MFYIDLQLSKKISCKRCGGFKIVKIKKRFKKDLKKDKEAKDKETKRQREREEN